MAIDTVEKRKRAWDAFTGAGRPYPDGTIASSDRAWIWGLYYSPTGATPYQTLSGTVKNISGDPVRGAVITAKIVGYNNVFDRKGIGTQRLSDTTDIDGNFSLLIVKNALVRIIGVYNSVMFYDNRIIITSDGTANLADYNGVAISGGVQALSGIIGDPVKSGASVAVTPVGNNLETINCSYTLQPATTSSDINGEFSVDVAKGMPVRVEITHSGSVMYDKRIIISNEDTADLTDYSPDSVIVGGMQTLSGTTAALNLDVLQGASVSAQYVGKNMASSSVIYDNSPITATTSSVGYFSLSVAKGSTVRMVISYNSEIIYDRRMTITTDDNKDLADYDT